MSITYRLRRAIVLWLIGWSCASLAGEPTTTDRYIQTLQEIKGIAQTSASSSDTQDIQALIPQTPSSLTDLAGHPDDAAEAGAHAAQTSEIGQAVTSSIHNRPQYSVTGKEDFMQRSDDIIAHANDQGSSVVCEPLPKQCTTTTTKHICLLSHTTVQDDCTAQLHVAATPQADKTVSITVTMTNYTPPILQGDRSYAYDWWDIDLIDGTVHHARGGGSPQLSDTLNHYPSSIWRTTTLDDGQVAQTTWNRAQVDAVWSINEQLITHRDRHLHLYITFNAKKISRLPSGQAPTQWIFPFHITVPQPAKTDEYWQNDCGDLEAAHCSVKSSECLSPHETRMINGVAITRDCWSKVLHESCDQSTTTCTPWQEAGCSVSDSVCLNTLDNRCLQYQQTYSCVQQQCTQPQGMDCGGTVVCPNGDCTHPSEGEDIPMAQALSPLLALQQQTVSEDAHITLLAGQAQECVENALDYKNCCALKGWGVHFKMAQCSDEERKLAEARQHALVVPVGRYCAKRTSWPGGSVCRSHHEVFCVFGSKLARLIQTQGRAQLGWSFGSVDGDTAKPDCAGFSPEQFQKLNFASMDFSEIEQDIRASMPNMDNDALEHQLKQDINQAVEKTS